MKPVIDPFQHIPPFDAYDRLNVIVDTPKNSANKYEFDEESGMFRLGGVIALGHSFPFDFGFIPNTLGGDGDPLDVLILMDEPAFVGCLVKCRIIGGIKVQQTEKTGETIRNDRFLAVAAKSLAFCDVNSIADLNENFLEQIEHFFISYNEVKGKIFDPVERFDEEKARRLIGKSAAGRNGSK